MIKKIRAIIKKILGDVLIQVIKLDPGCSCIAPFIFQNPYNTYQFDMGGGLWIRMDEKEYNTSYNLTNLISYKLRDAKHYIDR